MNRRQFNQTMAALGAIATLPAFARQTDVLAKPELVQEKTLVRIGLVSVGGADGNAIGSIANGLQYITRTIAIDTDAFALSSTGADRTVLIGNGAHRPMHPRQAYNMARERETKIEDAIGDLDLVIVMAGLYGAAGKGIAPVVAEIAKRRDIGMLCIAITPAAWQGVDSNPRVRNSMNQIQRAGAIVFPIHSESMAKTLGEDTPLVSQAINDLCAALGHAINQFEIVGIDVDDLRLALEPGSIAAMGFGVANGSAHIERAVKRAIAHPLMGMDRLLSATGVVINIRAAGGLQISKVSEAVRGIRRLLALDTHLLYSASIDETIGDKVIVSILATVPLTADVNDSISRYKTVFQP